MFQLEELQALEHQLPNFHFIPALSEPAVDDAWEGETGLITDVAKRLVSNGAGKEAYMCGPTAMIDAAIVTLTRLGMEEINIFYNKFVTKADTAG